ncbi:MAG: hypothetical protein PHI49_01315 [Halothiobacillaceae bacterium]|nr:hypothetical protein [Halothiobacillaceae bacterium]
MKPVLLRAAQTLLLGTVLGGLAACTEETPSPTQKADLSRLIVHGTPGDEILQARIAARFREVGATSTHRMQAAGDVLLLDARQDVPETIGDANHVFRQAFDAGVPILVMNMDDAFERAVLRLMPGLLDVGPTGLALVIPPRVGRGAEDGALLHIAREKAQRAPWRVSEGAINTLLDQLHSPRRPVARGHAQDQNSETCSAADPNLCSLVKKTALARTSFVVDYASDGACLTRDWQYVAQVDIGVILALAEDSSSQKYSSPQCPTQIINFYPTLYLNDTANGPQSRVVVLGMDANLNPGVVSQRDANALFWYQTYFDMAVLPAVYAGPDPITNGIQWLANLPHSADNQHTVTDSAGWSLNVAARSDGEVTGGGTVSFTHTVSNTVSDWKYIDRTSQQAAQTRWGFTSMQAFPYPGDSSEDCEGTSDVFNWAGIACHALPQSVRYDTVPDLSRASAVINGLAVWDLGKENNPNTTAQLTLSTTTRFDAVGCGRWSKSGHWDKSMGLIAAPDDLGDYSCSGISFINAGQDGTWTRRAQHVVIKQFLLDLSLLPIGK